MPETLDIPAELREHAQAQAAPEQAQHWLQVAQSYQIDDDDMYAAAGDELRNIVTMARDIEAQRKAITAPMDEAKRRVMDFFRVPLDRLGQAESTLKASMAGYQRLQLQRAAAEQRRAQEAAAEQRRAQEAAAAEQRAAEAAAQAERDRLQAEAEAQMQRAIDTGDAQAIAQAEQTMAAAAAVQAAPVEQPAQIEVPVAAPVVPLAPRAAGVSVRTVWKARVVDKSAFIRAAAGRPEIEAILDIDEGRLNQFAKATAGKANLAGVTFYEEPVVSARRRTGS